jgi:hypothetical protein
VISTGTGSGDTGCDGQGDIYVFNVGPANKLSNQQLFTDFMIDGVKCGPDDALRRRRQFVVLEQRRPCRRVQWRDGVETRKPS